MTARATTRRQPLTDCGSKVGGARGDKEPFFTPTTHR